ncbi:5-methyltetrahydropteroyltriglutamate-homocysteine methyltransferase-like [Capsicum galapagoense]
MHSLDGYTQTLGIWCQFHKVVAEQLDLKRKQYEDMKLVFTPSMFEESERASELNQEIINLEHAMHEILHRFCLEGLRHPVERKMASHIVGNPRMGQKGELKFALESFWDGKSTAEDLKKVSVDLRSSIWKQMSDAGIKYIPSNQRRI